MARCVRCAEEGDKKLNQSTVSPNPNNAVLSLCVPDLTTDSNCIPMDVGIWRTYVGSADCLPVPVPKWPCLRRC
eukprot:3879141-Rhodomonas_salina.1